MDRFDELTVFLAVVEEGSLAAAGRRLRRSPATVTRALASLEERAGVRLVERSTRSSSLTQAGARFAERARSVLADYDEALLEAAEDDRPRGRLRVTAPEVFGRRHIAPIVTAFLDAYPEVRGELLLSDSVVDLVGEGLDVALRIGTLADSSLSLRKVGRVRRVLCASPEYLDTRGRPSEPAELVDHDLIWHARASGASEWRFQRAGGGEQAVRVDPRLVVDRVAVGVGAAREGKGILSALSYQVAEELAEGRLERILAAHELAPLPVQLVFASRRLMPARVRAFLDFAAPRLDALAVLHAR